MRKVLLLLVGTAVLWVPAASIAGGSSSGPLKPPSATETPDANHASNAATTCRSQQSGPNFEASHNGKTFAQFYATNGGKGRGAGANAFGKCVSGIAKHSMESDGKDIPGADGKDSAENHSDSSESHSTESGSPAFACKTMKANDLAHFQTTYGSRPNAFGHCVAAHASGNKD